MMKNNYLDGDSYTLRALSLEPKQDTEGRQKHDRSGTPQFVLLCLVEAKDGHSTPELVKTTLTLPAAELPKLSTFSPVRLVGWTARLWNLDGRAGIAYSAEGVQPISTGGGRS